MDTTNIPDNINDLIITYLADKDQMHSDELETLGQWIQASAENRKYFIDRQEIWFATGCSRKSKYFDKDLAYMQFLGRVDQVQADHHIPKKKHLLRPFLYRAVAVALLLIVSYVSYYKGNEILKDKFANITIETPLGSRTKVYLPDSTLVWLNAGSRITYSQGYGVDDRNIELIGEGYFEVQKNPELPFSVNTNELNVNVLGTKFNFKNYPDDEEATVSLLEGKVKVSNALIVNNHTELLPDQKLFLNKKTGEMKVITINAQYTNVWTAGSLFFDEELLPDIVKELERSYNVKISIADESLNNFRFYGNFERQENDIEDILEMLASTGKIRYSITGKNIELNSN